MDKPSAPVGPGDVIGGKYRVERVLAQGGIGVVLVAKHVVLGERVALKFLLPSAAADPQAAPRFLREARAMARIQSDRVVRVSDVATLASGEPYMVMEYLEGRDLCRELQAVGALPIALAVDYALQACEALAEAHALGIVHRDLKPANLFLVSKNGAPAIKVLDFGLAKDIARSPTGEQLTLTTVVLGTPAYMSPEQIRSTGTVDARGDVWAMAVVLFELLANALPFGGDTPNAMLARIMTDEPESLRAFRPDVPPALEAAIAAALVKDRDRRTPSIAAFADALAPFSSAAHESVARIAHATARGQARSLPPPESPPLAATPVLSNSTQLRRRRRLIVAIAAFFALVFAGGALLARSHFDAPKTPAAMPPSTPSASVTPPIEAPAAASSAPPAAPIASDDKGPTPKPHRPPPRDLTKILGTRK